jgi:hypothetical protein
MRDNTLPITHIVTAGEAAYATLFCHISELHKGGEWTNGVIPEYRMPWHIYLTALYVEVLRAGVPVKGIPLALYSQYAPVGNLCLVNNLQGYLGRAHWFGHLFSPYGFGMLSRLGAVAANDVIVIGGVYEPL